MGGFYCNSSSTVMMRPPLGFGYLKVTVVVVVVVVVEGKGEAHGVYVGVCASVQTTFNAHLYKMELLQAQTS